MPHLYYTNPAPYPRTPAITTNLLRGRLTPGYFVFNVTRVFEEQNKTGSKTRMLAGTSYARSRPRFRPQIRTPSMRTTYRSSTTLPTAGRRTMSRSSLPFAARATARRARRTSGVDFPAHFLRHNAAGSPQPSRSESHYWLSGQNILLFVDSTRTISHRSSF